MMSPRLLVLLLMGTFLFLSCATPPPTAPKKGVVSKVAAHVPDKAPEALGIAAGVFTIAAASTAVVVPAAITLGVIAGVLGMASATASYLQKKKEKDIAEMAEFQKALEQYQSWEDLKWSNAAKDYDELCKGIDRSWIEFKKTLDRMWQAKDDKEIKEHKNYFVQYYKPEEHNEKLVDKLLTNGVFFQNNFGDEIAKHYKCHEHDIIKFIQVMNALLYKGVLMNLFYSSVKHKRLSNTEVNAEFHQIEDANSVMHSIREGCLKQSMTYVTQDVEEMMTKATDKQELAKEILPFLSQTYDRYDWMVAVFKTKSSNQKVFKVFKSHTLKGFTEIEKDGITVAVARQVKGEQAAADVVKKAMEKCFPQPVKCYQVGENLDNCEKEFSKVFTAVHAYRKKPHYEPMEENEVPEDAIALPDTNPPPSYIQSGDCKNDITKPTNKNPKFVVMIKSQDEISKTDPCSKLDCDGGTCVVVDTVLAVCECSYTSDGKTCVNVHEFIALVLSKTEQLANLE